MAGPRRSRGAPKHPLDCHERALRLLSVRPRSRRELQTRLLRAGFDAEEVGEELSRLESVGLIDDEAFARQVAEHEVAVRGSGRRAVVDRLMARGVDRAVIDRALEDLDASDEESRALALAETRVGRLASLEPRDAYRRLVPFLQRRGYGTGVAHRAAARALGLDAAG
jgi:regulatory protein